MILIGLFLLGLAFGSFVNALVWRLRRQETDKNKPKAKYSIIKGRSMCPNCEHELAIKDLVPVFSWLMLKAKCRYCHKPISWQYPLVELILALLFAGSYLFWPADLSAGQNLVEFVVWLLALTGLLALAVYDVRYMILPNKIIFPLLLLGGLGVIIQAFLSESIDPIEKAGVGLLVGGGIFYVLFQISNGKWIGGGDVKLGFLLGVLVGGPAEALIMLFAASLLGTALSLPLIAKGKATAKTRIPFGPFLIAGAILAQLFGQSLVNWYLTHLLFSTTTV